MKQGMLITGGSGLLALNWAIQMRDAYAITLGLHNRKLELAGVQAKSIAIDTEANALHVLDELKPGLVVHTAGLTSVEQCEENPDKARLVNVTVAANVAKACAKAGVPLIHISTDHLFSGKNSLSDEAGLLAPINVYAKTKAEAEQQVLNANPAALVLRTNFYGWGPSYRPSFSDAIIKALRHKKTITLFDDVYYTPIIINKLVSATHALIQRKASGIFNLVGDERISKYAFGLKIAERFQLDSGLIVRGLMERQTGLVKRPLDMSLSNQKVCELLGEKLGTVAQQLDILHQQEHSGLAQEIQRQ